MRILTDVNSTVINIVSDRNSGVDAHFPYTNSATIVYVPSRLDNSDTGNGSYVNVIGSVVRPGRYSVSGPIKLVDILSIAGGPSDKGRLSRVRVVEDKAGYTMAQTFDLEDYVESGGITGRLTIKPGSTVYVARSIGAALELPLRVLTDIAIISTTVALWATLIGG